MTTLVENSVQSLVLARGVRLEYMEQGDPTGVPVIFLPGMTDSWRSFELVLPYLPPSVRAIAFSLRGHGDSSRPAVGYHPRDFAADLADALLVLGVKRAVVVGHSMGTAVAQRFAADHPARVRGMMLIGGFASLTGNEPLNTFWETAVSTLDDPIDPAFAREFQESTLAQPIPGWYLDTVVAESLKVPARVWRAAFKGMLTMDSAGQLGAVAAPVRLLWGDRDEMISRGDQDDLLAALPNADLTVYRGAGHAVHWEEPGRVAAELIAWLDGLAV